MDLETKIKINNFYLLGYISDEIEIKLNNKFTLESIDEYISLNLTKSKKEHKYARKKRIEDYYISGMNAKEIAKRMLMIANTVQRYINRNLYMHKEKHSKNRIENRHIKKAIDNTNNSFISGSSFLKQNRQAYTYNKNLNITFDENVNGVRTIDTPKTFYHNR